MRNKKKCKKDSNPPIYLNICLKIITLAQPDIDFFVVENFRLSYFQC